MGKTFFASVASLLLAAPAAQAATVYATEVVGVGGPQASCSVASSSTNRADLCNALGEEDVDGRFAEGGFLSSGNYDSLTFTFDTLFNGPLTIWEVTGGRNLNYVESIKFTFQNTLDVNIADVMGTATNVDGTPDGRDRWEITTATAAIGPFNQLVISDMSNTPDGFDIDAVAVNGVDSLQPIPLPAGMVLMLTALGGLAVARRRA